MLNRKGTIETLVVSIAGNPPTDPDWDQLFTRMAGKYVILVRCLTLAPSFTKTTFTTAILSVKSYCLI